MLYCLSCVLGIKKMDVCALPQWMERKWCREKQIWCVMIVPSGRWGSTAVTLSLISILKYSVSMNMHTNTLTTGTHLPTLTFFWLALTPLHPTYTDTHTSWGQRSPWARRCHKIERDRERKKRKRWHRGRRERKKKKRWSGQEEEKKKNESLRWQLLPHDQPSSGWPASMHC